MQEVRTKGKWFEFGAHEHNQEALKTACKELQQLHAHLQSYVDM